MPRHVTAFRTAFASLTESSARQQRLVSAQRIEVGQLLASEDLRRLADSDVDLSAAIDRHELALDAADQAATAWHEELAAATEQWAALLAELADIHGND